MALSESSVVPRIAEKRKPRRARKAKGSTADATKTVSAEPAPESEELSFESSNTGGGDEASGDSGVGVVNGSVDSLPYEDAKTDDVEIKAVIRRRKDGAFLVYLDNDFQVRWDRTKDVFGNGSYNANPKDVERILARAQTTGAIPVPFLTEQQIETKSRFVGEAVALALSGDVQAANQTLKDARDFIRAKAVEKARIWTVEGSLVSFVVLLATFLFVVVNLNAPTESGLNVRELSIAAIFGLIGSQFSLLQRVNRLEVAPLAGAKPHVIEAFSRILVGALGGIIMYVVLRAELFFGFIDHNLSDRLSEHWVTWALVIVAGASERLIPNFMTTIETQAAGDLVGSDENLKAAGTTG